MRSTVWNPSIPQIMDNINLTIPIYCFTFWGTSSCDTVHFVEWWNSKMNQFSSPVINFWNLFFSWALRMSNNFRQVSIRICGKLVVDSCRIQCKWKFSYQAIPANNLRENFADSEDTDPCRSHPRLFRLMYPRFRFLSLKLFQSTRDCVERYERVLSFIDDSSKMLFDILKNIKIISLVRECTRQFLFKIRYNRDWSANHNRSEILWTNLPDANPWNHNWEEHVFISVSQDGLCWQLSDATEQVRS
jgi:hypothetical protein